MHQEVERRGKKLSVRGSKRREILRSPQALRPRPVGAGLPRWNKSNRQRRRRILAAAAAADPVGPFAVHELHQLDYVPCLVSVFLLCFLPSNRQLSGLSETRQPKNTDPRPAANSDLRMAFSKTSTCGRTHCKEQTSSSVRRLTVFAPAEMDVH